MSDLPDDFDCTITNWEYIYGLCRTVADEVKRAEFEPDVVVALARGGWFAGRCWLDAAPKCACVLLRYIAQ